MKTLAKFFSTKMVGAMEEKIRKERGKSMQTSTKNHGGNPRMDCLGSLSGRSGTTDSRSGIYPSRRLAQTLAARLDPQESSGISAKIALRSKVVGRGLWFWWVGDAPPSL